MENQPQVDQEQLALRELIRPLFDRIIVPKRTEARDIAVMPGRVHLLLRVLEDGLQWWYAATTAILGLQLTHPMEIHICQELRLDETGALRYVWNFMLAADAEQFRSCIEAAVDALDEVRQHELKRTPIDRVKLFGGADRNVPRQGSKKGASLFRGRG